MKNNFSLQHSPKEFSQRPPKDRYYLNIAKQIAQRSTCFRVRFGAIVVKEDAIVATGYVGAPRKTLDCFERGECLRDRMHIPHGHRYEICRSVHAEQNALINAARSGASVLGADMFIYGEKPDGELIDAFPCFICKKMVINAGLERVVCSTHEGGYQVFKVKDWIQDWQKKDIIDDKHQYGIDQNKKGS
ncbi:MAG: hypothetical protein GF370_00430 [Candidatus Nealsonbacteria bacterium]|nr:hypothetical protein [Candidatus Nealsonbacteria bacterium]